VACFHWMQIIRNMIFISPWTQNVCLNNCLVRILTSHKSEISRGRGSI
jgi:hypothetical protein